MKAASTSRELKQVLSGVRKGDRKSQKELYRQFYGYAMAVCLRYANNREEAEEIVNDSFMKVFLRIKTYNRKKAFKSWFRSILVHTAIDYFRQHQKHFHQMDLVHAIDYPIYEENLDRLSAQQLIELIQQLTPAYRLVFNLSEIEGYTHKEIAEKLGISIGTSKSNLARARIKLKKMLAILDQENVERYG